MVVVVVVATGDVVADPELVIGGPAGQVPV